jgi:O-antigen ligase
MNQVYRLDRIPYVGRQSSDSKQLIFLVLLGMIWGCAVFLNGGVVYPQARVLLLALGLLGLFYRFFYRGNDLVAGILAWWIYLLPGYVALQLVPLPASVLRILSPARAEIHQAVAVLAPERFAPLSVAPVSTMHHLLLVAGYCLVFVLVRHMSSRRENRWILVAPLVVAGTLEAILGTIQSSLGLESTGTYTNQDHYAAMLEMLLPFTLAYAFAVWRQADTRRSFPLRPALWICGSLAAAAVMLAGILGSLSRMAFVAALFSILVMAVAGLTGKRKIPAVAVLIAGLIVLFVFLPSEQLVFRFAKLSSAGDFNARLDLWRESLAVWRAFPFFGCGLGGFESVFLRYKTSAPMISDDFVHNDYLQFLIELGLVGFAIGGVLLGAVLARTVRAASSDAPPGTRFLALGCIGAFAALGLHSFVDFNLYVPANAMLLAWISGIGAGLGKGKPRPRPRGHGQPVVINLVQHPPDQ